MSFGTGRMITPHDPGYDQARTGFDGGIDRHPALIVRPADATDVSRVVALAGETGLELAVRSGGRSSVQPFPGTYERAPADQHATPGHR